MVNGALRECKMQNDELQIKGKVTAGYGSAVTVSHEHDVYGRPWGWDATHKLRVAALEGGTRKVMNPLAYYADMAAEWLIEQPVFTTKSAKGHEETAQDKQPIFTMKAMKAMKEMAGMGQPGYGKGLSAEWGGFTQIDSQAAGFNPLRSSVKSADNDDLPVLPLAGFDPNAIGIEAAEEPNSLVHAKTTRRNGEMAELAGVSELPVGLSDADATEGRSANIMKKRFLTPFSFQNAGLFDTWHASKWRSMGGIPKQKRICTWRYN